MQCRNHYMACGVRARGKAGEPTAKTDGLPTGVKRGPFQTPAGPCDGGHAKGLTSEAGVSGTSNNAQRDHLSTLGGGGNRTRVLQCITRASPGAACCAFLSPGDHASKFADGLSRGQMFRLAPRPGQAVILLADARHRVGGVPGLTDL
jgi:hypothetical protein